MQRVLYKQKLNINIMNLKDLNSIIEILENENKISNKKIIEFYKKTRRELVTKINLEFIKQLKTQYN
jgi:hypothetical protein